MKKQSEAECGGQERAAATPAAPCGRRRQAKGGAQGGGIRRGQPAGSDCGHARAGAGQRRPLFVSARLSTGTRRGLGPSTAYSAPGAYGGKTGSPQPIELAHAHTGLSDVRRGDRRLRAAATSATAMRRPTVGLASLHACPCTVAQQRQTNTYMNHECIAPGVYNTYTSGLVVAEMNKI